MIKNFEENKESILYYFTRYEEDEGEELKNKFLQYFEEKEKEPLKDEGLLAILDDIIEKSEPEAKIILPLKQKAKEYFNEINKLKALKEPFDQFNFSLGSDSKFKLSSFMTNCVLRVSNCLKNKDYTYISYLINNICALKEYLTEEQAINNSLTDILKLLNEALHSEYKKYTKNIEKCVSTKLELEEIEEYFTHITQVKQADELIDKYFTESKPPYSDAYIKFLSAQFDNLYEQFQKLEIEDKDIIEILEKIKIVLPKLKPLEKL